jgi:hypothetical protein
VNFSEPALTSAPDGYGLTEDRRYFDQRAHEHAHELQNGVRVDDPT